MKLSVWQLMELSALQLERQIKQWIKLSSKKESHISSFRKCLSSLRQYLNVWTMEEDSREVRRVLLNLEEWIEMNSNSYWLKTYWLQLVVHLSMLHYMAVTWWETSDVSKWSKLRLHQRFKKRTSQLEMEVFFVFLNLVRQLMYLLLLEKLGL